MYVVLDIETTGFSRDGDNILEVGYIRIDHNLNIHQSGTLFFYKDDFRIESAAQSVHRLSRSYLQGYADEFDTNICALYSMMYNSTIIGKNSNTFDMPFIQSFCNRYMKDADVPALKILKALDLQDVYTPIYRQLTGESRKKGTLEDYAKMLEISDSEVQELYDSLNKPAGRYGYHTALYDTVVTYLLLKRGVEAGEIRLI